MDLKEASEKAFEISKKRGLNETTFEALTHCAGKVLEAVEANTRFVYSTRAEDCLPDELADIIICVLSICGMENIDIEKAIERKMKINEERTKETCGNCNFCEKNDGTPYCVMKDLYTSVDLDQKCDETDIRGSPYFSTRKQS